MPAVTPKPKNLYEALAEFQDKFPGIGFNEEGQVGTRTYGYATLSAILRAVRPYLRECGLVVYQQVVGLSVDTTVRHLESGEEVHTTVRLTECADMQKMGSAITYARRYGIAATLGICPDKDDDGAATVAGSEPAEVAEKRTTAVKAHEAATAPAAPAGWDSNDDAIVEHNALAARITQLPEEYKQQCVEYRQEHGWPLAKDKFDDLDGMVALAARLADGA